MGCRVRGRDREKEARASPMIFFSPTVPFSWMDFCISWASSPLFCFLSRFSHLITPSFFSVLLIPSHLSLGNLPFLHTSLFSVSSSWIVCLSLDSCVLGLFFSPTDEILFLSFRSSYSSDKSSSLFPIPEPILQSRNRSAISHSATHRYSAQPDSLSTEQDSAKFSPRLSSSTDLVVSSSSRSELPLWQELIDSNLRSGTIACLWCLRTLFLRRVSRAFHRWRVNTLVPPSTSAGVVPQPTPEEEDRDLLLRDYQTLIDKFGTVNQQHPSLQQAMSLLSRMREADPTIGVTPGQISSSYSGMSSNTQYGGEEMFFPWQQRASSHNGITSSGPPQSMSEQSYHGNHGNSVQPQWTQQPIMHQQMDYPQEPQHTSVYQNQQTLPPPPPQHQNNWSQPPLPPNNQQWNISSSQPPQPLSQQWPPASQPGWQSQPVQQGHTAPYIATPTPQPVTEITPSASEAGQLSHLVRISHTLLDRNADPETKRQILCKSVYYYLLVFHL